MLGEFPKRFCLLLLIELQLKVASMAQGSGRNIKMDLQLKDLTQLLSSERK